VIPKFDDSSILYQPRLSRLWYAFFGLAERASLDDSPGSAVAYRPVCVDRSIAKENCQMTSQALMSELITKRLG